MKITGGRYRSRILQCPKGVIRPAMSRMRESMFSILGPIDGLAFLDLFSGSGLIGIEAASRGAQPVELVEKDRIKRKTLLKNRAIAEDAEIRIHMMPAEAYIRRCSRSYPLIHMDPPFPMKNKQHLLEMADQYRILSPEGTLMIHYPGEEELPETVGSLRRYDHRTYGRSRLAFYTREADSAVQKADSPGEN